MSSHDIEIKKYLQTMRWQEGSKKGINSTLGQQGPSKKELCQVHRTIQNVNKNC